MKPNKFLDFIFMILGTFTMVTGLAVVIDFFNDSLTYDKFIYALIVCIVYFLSIVVRKKIRKIQ